MRAEQNELLTRIGPGTRCGAVLRQYWHPVALLEEFDPALHPEMAERPLKTVRVLGEDLVLFKDAGGAWGLLGRACPHRGADLYDSGDELHRTKAGLVDYAERMRAEHNSAESRKARPE
jgi:hypothetical protein